MLGFGSIASAVRCCSAFDELRQDCRVRQRRGAQVPLAEQRRLFAAALAVIDRGEAGRIVGAAGGTPRSVRAGALRSDRTQPELARSSAPLSRQDGSMTACATDRRFAAGSPLPPSACGSQQPRRPGRGCLDFPGKQSVHGRAMDQPLANPLLPALIATYLARCAVEGKSPRIVQAYRETLTRFSRCLVEDGAPLDPDSIRPDHVVAYLARFAAPQPRHPSPLLPRGALLLHLAARGRLHE